MDWHLIQTVHASTEAQSSHSSGLMGSLGIDPWLLLAQLVNFGIVILVMYKWVFKPLGDILAERQQKIDQSLSTAKEIEVLRQEIEIEKKQVLHEAHALAQDVIHKAKVRGDEIVSSKSTEAEFEAKRIIEQAQKQVAADKTQAIVEVKEHIADLVVQGVEKVLRKKVDAKEDARMIAEAVSELRHN